jgi:hypothetical protein
MRTLNIKLGKGIKDNNFMLSRVILQTLYPAWTPAQLKEALFNIFQKQDHRN